VYRCDVARSRNLMSTVREEQLEFAPGVGIVRSGSVLTDLEEVAAFIRRPKCLKVTSLLHAARR
jgi:hypothetical protein